MFLLTLVLLLVVAPLVELYVIVQVAQAIGALEVIALLVIIALIGTWVMRMAGTNVFLRSMGQLAQGRTPADELIDGAVLLAAGLLLVLPGFLSDAVALVLFLPPVRALVRAIVRRRIARRVAQGRTSVFVTRFGRVIDVDGQAVWRPTRHHELP